MSTKNLICQFFKLKGKLDHKQVNEDDANLSP